MNYSNALKVNWVTPIRTATRACIEIQKFYNFDVFGIHEAMVKNKNDYQLIFNIRNPYSRLVSIFYLWKIHNPKKNSILFEDWVKAFTDKLHSNVDTYTLFLDKIVDSLPKPPDFYVRLEFLEFDLRNLWFIDNQSVDVNNLIKNNITKNKYKSSDIPWESYYNQELADLVYSRMERQFEMFNYNKNYWKDGTP